MLKKDGKAKLKKKIEDTLRVKFNTGETAELFRLFPMPEVTARNFLHDITRLLGEASKELGYAIRGSPEATMNYVSLMTGLRMDLARGACGWFSLKQAGIGEREEYSEFEDLAVQWDRYSQLGCLF